MSETCTCKYCDTSMEADAKNCPRCGSYSISMWPLKILALLLMFVSFGGFAAELAMNPEAIHTQWGLALIVLVPVTALALATVFGLPRRQWHPSQLIGMSR